MAVSKTRRKATIEDPGAPLPHQLLHHQGVAQFEVLATTVNCTVVVRVADPDVAETVTS